MSWFHIILYGIGGLYVSIPLVCIAARVALALCHRFRVDIEEDEDYIEIEAGVLVKQSELAEYMEGRTGRLC